MVLLPIVPVIKKILHIGLLAAVVCACTLSSCRKKEGDGCVHGTQTSALRSDDKTTLVYNGTEELRFVNIHSGDTILYVGNGLKKDYLVTRTQEDCYQNLELERNYIDFLSSTNPDILHFQVAFYSTVSVEYTLTLGHTNFHAITSFLRDKSYDFDSLVIQGKTYKNVDFFSNDFASNPPTTYGCYYTRSDGIIKLVRENGETWELLNR